MKKIMQNILARRSNNKIAYLCGKCGKEVDKEADICRHCGAKLGSIKCPFCNFTGSIIDFKFDTCPKCGRSNPGHQNHETSVYLKKKLEISKKTFWFLFFLLLSAIISVLYILFYLFK